MADLEYEKEAISKELYDFLLKNKYADANLIAKWKKQGYEKADTRGIEICLFRLDAAQTTQLGKLVSPPSE
jgi:hypothetical protein